jgi:hypothetical protein
LEPNDSSEARLNVANCYLPEMHVGYTAH